MKKQYQAPWMQQEYLVAKQAILAADADAGSFQDGWLHVDDTYKEEF